MKKKLIIFEDELFEEIKHKKPLMRWIIDAMKEKLKKDKRRS